MESLRELYRIGPGPSASHTMGPRRAAEIFRERYPECRSFHVGLYGSLAATGKGHLTDVAIIDALQPYNCEIAWHPLERMPVHPNGMYFRALGLDGSVLGEWRVYSVGGGALRSESGHEPPPKVYPATTMAEVLEWCKGNDKPIWAYVEQCEGAEIWDYLRTVWATMKDAVARGTRAEGTLPGVLNLKRKSKRHLEQSENRPESIRRTGLLTAYALAVSEENAGGGVIVTAPTCGACGVLPGTLFYLYNHLPCDEEAVLRALATAGLIGNLVKRNASISGAAVGCQGEVGTACAMAAGATAQIMGGDVAQVEYAAEMGFEHHLGLTCDPIAGLVQIPCIERNAVGATRAIACAEYALLSDGSHEVPFDEVVETMRQTGEDMQERYRETSMGGLAAAYAVRGAKPNQCS